MTNPELLDYLKQFAQSGQGFDSAKKILLGAGFEEEEIETAVRELGGVKIFEKPEEFKAVAPRVIDIPIRKRSPKIWYYLGLMILVALSVIFYASYFRSANQTPQERLDAAFNNLWAARSFRYDAKGKLSFEGRGPSGNQGEVPGKSSLALDFNLGGDSNLADKNNPKASMDLNTSFSGGEISEVSLGMELVFLKEAVYLKLGQADGWGGVFKNSLLMSEWIRLRPEEWAQFLGGDANLTLLTRDYWEGLRRLLGEGQFLKVRERLGDEAVEGRLADHFRLVINTKALGAAMARWFDLAISAPRGNLEEGEKVTRGKFEAWVKEKLKTLEESANISGSLEIWVDKKSQLPSRIFLGGAIEDKKQTSGLTFNLDIFYSKFNEPVSVNAPTADKSLQDLVRGWTIIKDDLRVRNLKEIQKLLGNYYGRCGFYPGPENCVGGFKSAPESWSKLLKVLKKSGFEDKRFNIDLNSDSIYQYGSDGSNYFIGVTLSSILNPVFKGSVLRGNAFGVRCDHTVFCISSFRSN